MTGEHLGTGAGISVAAGVLTGIVLSFVGAVMLATLYDGAPPVSACPTPVIVVGVEPLKFAIEAADRSRLGLMPTIEAQARNTQASVRATWEAHSATQDARYGGSNGQ